MKCPNCLDEISDDAAFCPDCGTDLAPWREVICQEQSATSQHATPYWQPTSLSALKQTSTKKIKTEHIILMVLLGLLATILLCSVMSQNSGKRTVGKWESTSNDQLYVEFLPDDSFADADKSGNTIYRGKGHYTTSGSRVTLSYKNSTGAWNVSLYYKIVDNYLYLYRNDAHTNLYGTYRRAH